MYKYFNIIFFSRTRSHSFVTLSMLAAKTRSLLSVQMRCNSFNRIGHDPRAPRRAPELCERWARSNLPFPLAAVKHTWTTMPKKHIRSVTVRPMYLRGCLSWGHVPRKYERSLTDWKYRSVTSHSSMAVRQLDRHSAFLNVQAALAGIRNK